MRSIRLLAFLAGCAVTAHAGLIHEYLFDTDASDSAGIENGTLFNGASVSGGTLNLVRSSSQYVEFGAYIVPTGANYTITFDEQANSFSGIHEFISQGGGPGFYLGYDGGSNFRAADAWGSGGLAFPVDTAWHHIALVVDVSGGNFTVYVDYASVGTYTAVPTNGPGTFTRLGRQYDGHSEYFDGQIDNVRIYDQALTAEELAPSSTPEPSTFLLGGFGVALLLRKARKR